MVSGIFVLFEKNIGTCCATLTFLHAFEKQIKVMNCNRSGWCGNWDLFAQNIFWLTKEFETWMFDNP